MDRAYDDFEYRSLEERVPSLVARRIELRQPTYQHMQEHISLARCFNSCDGCCAEAAGRRKRQNEEDGVRKSHLWRERAVNSLSRHGLSVLRLRGGQNIRLRPRRSKGFGHLSAPGWAALQRDAALQILLPITSRNKRTQGGPGGHGFGFARMQSGQ